MVLYPVLKILLSNSIYFVQTKLSEEELLTK